MYLDKLLKTKWEIEKQNEEGDIFVVMKQFSDRTYLHRLCRKIDMKNYEDLEKSYNIKLLPELKEFYTHYNGCNLFLNSVNIYGIWLGQSNPIDLALNDIKDHQEIADKTISQELLDDIVFFGVIGDYYLYYKQSEITDPKIYLAKSGTIVPSKIFGSIKETLEYYLKYLIPEYDEQGFRKHPNKDEWCKSFPLEQNSFWGEIDWED